MSVQNILNNPKKIDKIARRVFNMLDEDKSTMISYKEFRVLIVGILESLA